MRQAASALAVVLLAGLSSRAQEAEEWERDVAALAPGEETATTLIVDANTRQPLPGARITWYAEMEGLRAPALGTAVANAYGMATLDWDELATWNADGHFLITADGYAAAHAYGEFAPDVVEMERGRDVRTRVVDLLGRPVADGDVEVFLGCGHGPILDFVQTDADGLFTVSGQDIDEALLWIEHPGTCADYLELSDAVGLGAAERTLLLTPGVVAEGVVIDSAGRPLEGVEVRSYQRHRGPVGLTDRRGRFRLVGVEDEASLYFSHPHAIDGWTILDGDRWRAGTPMRLCLTPWGFAVETQDRATVEVRGAGEEVVLLRDEDGLTYLPEETEAEGVVTFVVPPGLYVPAASERLDPRAYEPLPIEARAGERVRVTLRAGEALAALRVVGEIPEGAEVRVAVPGAVLGTLDELVDEDAAEPERAVPREGRLVASVGYLGRTWFFEAGPATDGVREVRVEIPPPHHIRVPAAIRGDLRLVHDGLACIAEETDDGLRTYASGDLVLFAETADARYRIPLSLPGESGAPIDVAVPEAEPLRTLRVIPPPGVDEWMRVIVATESGGGHDVSARIDGPVERPVNGPVWVRVERDDHVVWTAHADGPGDVHVEWGDAALSFHVVDDGGDHVQATVLVDGVVVPQRDPDDFSVLRVLGLQPGAHTVLLLPKDDWFLAKEMRVVLAPGEIRRKRVTLTPR